MATRRLRRGMWVVAAAGLLSYGSGSGYEATSQGLGDLPGGGFECQARDVLANYNAVVSCIAFPNRIAAPHWNRADGLAALDSPFHRETFIEANGMSADELFIYGRGFKTKWLIRIPSYWPRPMFCDSMGRCDRRG